MYLATRDEWDRLIASLPTGRDLGLDTETYGHNVREASPAHRARIDVWSIGLPSGVQDARGYERYTGFVLPERALRYPAWLTVFAGYPGRWVLHNANHDRHALHRYGIELPRVFDTLEACRLLWPGRMGYGLKKLRGDLLGKPERDGYKDLVTDIVGVTKQGNWKEAQVPIESINPGDPKWAAKVAYAAEDAVDAPELGQLCATRTTELGYRLPESPW